MDRWGIALFVVGAVCAVAIVAVGIVPREETRAEVIESPRYEAAQLTENLYRIDSGPGGVVLEWQNSLITFMQDHPDLRITAMYAASEATGGSYTMFLVTEPREQCPPHAQTSFKGSTQIIY